MPPAGSHFFGDHAGLREQRAFLRLIARLRKKNWVVYAKPPFAGPEAVLAYLSRYTHRVAISNRRLISLDESGVTFRYKDYRRDGAERYRTMTLAADEFIRRFLLHVLPKGFHRIRHYGLLASAGRKANVARARQLLAVPPAAEPAEPVEPTGATAALSVLRRAHDHHRDLPTLDATARAAGLSRTNRDDDAVTRHGPCLRRVVALSHRPSTPRAPSRLARTVQARPIPDAIADFAHPWPRISAPIARQDCRNGDPEHAGERHTRHPQHSQILKSP